MEEYMRPYVKMLARRLGISYNRHYKTVDRAIIADDWNGVRVLIQKHDIRLIRNVIKVAEIIGRKNLYVDDLLSIPECQNPIIYDRIASGAAEGGHYDLLARMIGEGANNWNMMVEHAAAGGHLDIVEDLIYLGADDFHAIALYGAMAGYMDIVNYAIERNPYAIDGAIEGAARGGHRDMLDTLIESIPEDSDYIWYQDAAYGAAMGGHKDILMEAIRMANGDINLQDTANAAAINGHSDIVDELLDMMGEADTQVYITIAYNAAIGGNRHIVDDIMNMVNPNEEGLSTIARGAAEGGYINFVNTLIEKGASDLNTIALGAAAGGDIVILDYLIGKGADNYMNMAIEAGVSSHKNLLNQLVSRYHLSWNDIAIAMAEWDIPGMVEYAIDMGASNISDIIDTAEEYGHLYIVDMVMDMYNIPGHELGDREDEENVYIWEEDVDDEGYSDYEEREDEDEWEVDSFS